MKTIEEAIAAASRCLKDVGITEPRLESEFLLAAFLQVTRTRMILERAQALPALKVRRFQSWLQERQRRKPLAYVTGEQPFRDLKLKVTPDVLIPRPETELLVERALMVLDRLPYALPRQGACGSTNGGYCVIDVGTGSGNIALSLSQHANVRRVIGVDKSLEALKIARQNAQPMKRGIRVEWLSGDLLTPIHARRIQADLIVANLPYVCTHEMRDLEPELLWEPRMALDGGSDGLRLMEPCIIQAAEILRPGGFLLLEIGAKQSSAILTMLEKRPGWTDTQLFRDFAGLPRIVQTRKRGI